MAQPRSSLALSLCAALALVQAPALAQSRVLVVDDDGGIGVDHAEIQAAVLAASDGDVILIKDGSYACVDIDGKSLVLQAEAGARVVVGEPACLVQESYESLAVTNLLIGQSVTLIGLEIYAGPGGWPGLNGLRIEDCSGTVFVEECRVRGVAPVLRSFSAVEVRDSSSVVFIRTSVEAVDMPGAYGTGFGMYYSPPAALAVVNSSVHAYDSTFLGADAGYGVDAFFGVFGRAGGPAVTLQSGILFLANCTLIGGAGVQTPDGKTYAGGAGLAATGGTTHELNVAFIGGAAPTLQAGYAPGASGPATDIDLPATLSSFNGAALVMDATSPVREGEEVVYAILGPASAPVWHAYGFAPSSFALSVVEGTLLVAPPIDVRFLGLTDQSGRLVVPYRIPELGLGIDALQLYTQSLVFASPGGFTLGSAAAPLLLDARF